jgi:hypothetical protein
LPKDFTKDMAFPTEEEITQFCPVLREGLCGQFWLCCHEEIALHIGHSTSHVDIQSGFL